MARPGSSRINHGTWELALKSREEVSLTGRFHGPDAFGDFSAALTHFRNANLEPSECDRGDLRIGFEGARSIQPFLYSNKAAHLRAQIRQVAPALLAEAEGLTLLAFHAEAPVAIGAMPWQRGYRPGMQQLMFEESSEVGDRFTFALTEPRSAASALRELAAKSILPVQEAAQLFRQALQKGEGFALTLTIDPPESGKVETAIRLNARPSHDTMIPEGLRPLPEGTIFAQALRNSLLTLTDILRGEVQNKERLEGITLHPQLLGQLSTAARLCVVQAPEAATIIKESPLR